MVALLGKVVLVVVITSPLEVAEMLVFSIKAHPVYPLVLFPMQIIDSDLLLIKATLSQPTWVDDKVSSP